MKELKDPAGGFIAYADENYVSYKETNITEISCILNQLEDQIGYYDEKIKLLESALSSVLREPQEGCASNPGTASCELGVKLDGFRNEIQYNNDKLDILINRIML